MNQAGGQEHSGTRLEQAGEGRQLCTPACTRQLSSHKGAANVQKPWEQLTQAGTKLIAKPDNEQADDVCVERASHCSRAQLDTPWSG